MNLIKITTDGSVQIATVFSTGGANIPANDGYEAWEAIGGGFRAEISVTGRLELIGFLTSNDCIGYVRVYDITNTSIENRIMSQMILSNVSVPQVTMGPNFSLIGGHIYQIQVRCAGSNSNDAFNIVNITPKEV